MRLAWRKPDMAQRSDVDNESDLDFARRYASIDGPFSLGGSWTQVIRLDLIPPV